MVNTLDDFNILGTPGKLASTIFSCRSVDPSPYRWNQGIQPVKVFSLLFFQSSSFLVCCTSVSGLTVCMAPNTPPAHGKNTKVDQPIFFGKSVGHRNWFRSEMLR